MRGVDGGLSIGTWLGDVGIEVRRAFRTLLSSPGFTIPTALILTLSIGLNLALFQLVNATFLSPLPIKDPGSIVRLYRMSRHSESSGFPYAAASSLRDSAGVISALLTQARRNVVWGRESAEVIRGAFVSANWFNELGYGAMRGRVFAEGVDDRPEAPPVAVISHALWTRRFGADPEIAGRTVHVNNRPLTVIGVAPAGFPGVRLENVQVWIPIQQIEQLDVERGFTSDWTKDNVDLYGRLKPGVSLAAAKDALRATMQDIARSHPEHIRNGEWLEPYSGDVRFERGEDRRKRLTATWLIGGLTLLVLIVGCANLSNVVLTREIGRAHHLGIRMTLGASRKRIVGTLLTESVLLAVLGSTAGMFLASWASLEAAAMFDLPSYLNFDPDWRTTIAALLAAIVTPLIMALAPALKVSRQDLTVSIKPDGRQVAGGDGGRSRLRKLLIASQVAGSCLLLIVAGHLARSVHRTLVAHPGFSFKDVAVLDASLWRHGIEGASALSFWDDVTGLLAQHGGVKNTALISPAPLRGQAAVSIYPDAPALKVSRFAVSNEFFRVLGIPLLEGRSFERASDQDTAVVISRRLAMSMYGSTKVVGAGFPKSSPRGTIVGVAGDAHLIDVESDDAAEHYVLANENDAATLVMLVRSQNGPEHMIVPMTAAVRALDGRLIPQAWLMKSDFESRMRLGRFASAIAAVMALTALGITCLGVFSAVSCGLRQRMKEIGIRQALGAPAWSIVKVGVDHLTWPVAAGLAIGAGAAAGWGKLVENQPLYVELVDMPVYAAAALCVIVASGGAVLPPLARALRTDPLKSLRYE